MSLSNQGADLEAAPLAQSGSSFDTFYDSRHSSNLSSEKVTSQSIDSLERPPQSHSRSRSNSRPQPLGSTVNGSAPEAPKVTSPYRSRHQITRSISELYSPTRRSASNAPPVRDSTSTTNINPITGSSTSIASVVDGSSIPAPNIGFGLVPSLSHPSVMLNAGSGVTGRREAFDRMHAAQMTALVQPQQSLQQQWPRRSDLALAGSIENLQGMLATSEIGGSGMASPSQSRRTSLLGSALGEGILGLQNVSIEEEPKVHPVILPSSLMKPLPNVLATKMQSENLRGIQNQNQLQIVSREEQARLCRVQGVRTLEEMMNDLKDFSIRAMNTTDESYRSVIALYHSLQENVTSMRAMVDESEAVTSSFIQETVAIENDVRAQLRLLRNLDDRKKRIQEMQDRIQKGRDQMEGLSDRVEKVRETVARWQAADEEWQERTRKRLQIVWVGIFLVAVILVGLVILPANKPVDAVGVEAENIEESRVEVVVNETADIIEMAFVENKAAAVKAAAAVIRGEKKVNEAGVVGSSAAGAVHTPLVVSKHDTTSEWDESLRVLNEL